MKGRSKVTGVRHTSRALGQMGKNLLQPVNEASRFSLRQIVSQARKNLKANGSSITGELAKSLTVKRDPKSPKSKPRHVVGPRSDSPAVRRAHLVEFGTAPHFQPELNRLHPGAAAHPFLTPAYEAEKETVVKRFGQRFGQAVDKRAKRLAAKQGRGSP